MAEFLITHDHLVVYVTNEAIKKNRALLDGRWDKNDTKDSANAADLVAQGKCQFYDLPDIRLSDLRALLALRQRLKKQLHSCRVRVRNNLVAQYFPELDHCWNQAPEENLAIVRWCLSPQKMRADAADALGDVWSVLRATVGKNVLQAAEHRPDRASVHHLRFGIERGPR